MDKSEFEKRGILDREQLAKELKLKSAQTIVEWEKRGLPTLREGKTVLYSIDDVIEWMRRRARQRKRKAA